PGREIDAMVPPMMAQLLFDDILYGQVAREEHRRFQQLIRFIADDVYDIQDLLEEVFDDVDVKRKIVRDFVKRNRLGRRLSGWLQDQPAAALAEVLIGGIPNERKQTGDLPTFDLFPVPNYFFMRDPQVVVGDGVVIASMATQARRREALLSKYVFEYHKAFRGRPVVRVDLMSNAEGPTLEGGDVLVARRD